jgi:hypothetical protein
MRKLIVILCLLLVTSSYASDSIPVIGPNPLPLCDAALNSCEAEVLQMKDLLIKKDAYAALLKSQRDQAFEDLKKSNAPALLPWWGWALLGAAAFEVTRSLVK